MSEDIDFDDIERDVEELHLVDESYLRDVNLEKLGSLAARLVSQLVNGCGNTACRNTLCFIGRCNTSQAPIRKHTVRSARIIVLSLLFRSDIQTKLCSTSVGDLGYNSPQDPSSFEQQLVDTEIIKQLMSDKRIDVGSRIRKAIRARTQNLLALCELIKVPPCHLDGSENLDFMSNMVAAQYILTILRYIVKYMSEMCAPVDSIVDVNKFNHLMTRWPPWTEYDRRNAAKTASELIMHKNGTQAVLDNLQHCYGLTVLEHVCESLLYRLDLDDLIDAKEHSISKLISEHTSDAYYRDHSHEKPVWDLTILNAMIQLMVWRHWDGQPFIQRHSIAYAALTLIKNGYAPNDVPTLEIFWHSDNFAPFFDDATVAETYLRHEERQGQGAVHVLEFRFMFNRPALSRIFKTINHIRMSQSHATRSIIAGHYHEFFCEAGKHLDDPVAEAKIKDIRQRFLLLRVRRDHIIEDAFSQLWQRPALELTKPLRVRIVELDGFAMGQDLGGVQIEFFNILMDAIMQEDADLFTTNETGIAYFKPGSLQPLHMFEYIGMLMALALYNGIAIPVRLPLVLYYIIMDKDWSSREMRDRWATESHSVVEMMDEDVTEWQMSYDFNLAANGVQLLISPTDPSDAEEICELTIIDAHSSTRPFQKVDMSEVSWPGWKIVHKPDESRPVDEDNKEQFCGQYMFWLAKRSVQPQLNAFLKGFRKVVHPYTLKMLHYPELLREILEGKEIVDIAALRSSTQYEAFVKTQDYIQMFWKIVESWPAEKHKALVRFVTAAERLPNTGNLTFRISQGETGDDGRLPTSSTCFSTLYLPVYSSEEILEKNLLTAIEFGEYGFGIG